MTVSQPNVAGLTSAEAKRLQDIYGKNELSPQKKETFFQKVLHILCEPMFLLLIAAAVETTPSKYPFSYVVIPGISLTRVFNTLFSISNIIFRSFLVSLIAFVCWYISIICWLVSFVKLFLLFTNIFLLIFLII